MIKLLSQKILLFYVNGKDIILEYYILTKIVYLCFLFRLI